ncbi:MAG: 4Fe-4S double cluster binding domain-containing protein [Nitrospirota bacterium]
MNHKIKKLVETGGADFYGVADLSPAYDAILEQGGPTIAAYPRAISVGIALPHAIVDQLPDRTNRAAAVNYLHHGYDVINQRLDFLVSRVSSLIQQEGYQALPIPASKRIDEERICAAFSHKLAAHLSGLGWIGKSCLLITPEAGPRVRWATVLTDAPLFVTGKPLEERCGNCNQCVEICPVHAFMGKAFRAADPREVRYDAGKCDRYFQAMKKKDAELAVCGLCLYVCPHGKKRTSEQARL